VQQGINIIILECTGVPGACHCCSEPAMAFSRNRAMHALETLLLVRTCGVCLRRHIFVESGVFGNGVPGNASSGRWRLCWWR